MRAALFAFLSWPLACGHAPDQARVSRSERPAVESAFHAFEAKSIDGKPVPLSDYAGKVVLVVNVASRCGFTKQYAGLEALYEKHRQEGFVILGFPCDQFGNQEPGTEEEIKSFCSLTYDVTFPMFAKIEVNGPRAHPLWAYLRREQPGSFGKDSPGAAQLYEHLEKNLPEVLGTDAVKWNFTKFLVDRRGRVVTRFESAETPEAIEPQIVTLLGAR
jgi:glutathione peroxidase